MGTLGWRKRTLEERLLSKLNKNGPVPECRPDLGPCWIWNGCINDEGYGQVSVTVDVGVAVRKYTHIVSYEIYVGPIPEGKELDHLCRVRRCANYTHVEPVTHRENVLRGEGQPAIHAVQTHCVNGHPFTEKNTYIRLDNGSRVCRACLKIRGIGGTKRYAERHPRRRQDAVNRCNEKRRKEKIASGLSWSQFNALRIKQSNEDL